MDDFVKQAKLVADRVAHRDRIKREYQKLYQNPFRVRDTIVDPAAVRYEAAKAYAKEYFKFTPRSVISSVVFVGIVICGQIFLNREQRDNEKQIRTGEKTYYERALYKTRVLY